MQLHPGMLWGAPTIRCGFSGKRKAVRSCRDFIADALAANAYGYPDELRDNAVLCASELATNAIRHTRSGDFDGVFTALLYLRPTWIGLEVHDLGPRGERPSAPHAVPDSLGDPFATRGRGLAMIGRFSRGRYGYASPPECPFHTTWCELAA
ncbi:anti-sigma regulatory factor (Ser/Thr protein kinase) [Spinactinospora alkalitolerans]|uniref:Anti-sigma regulatory factor (Ser/Thr protein kinase) n=1 Tax=Spinactinospora alkalitolerans TaxID=687207 RepID=A0A852TUP4_9ACTN|nr:ATP-binding protein [Spinactinospora alkalitolerans]NYE45834.1 anti-sigma regulatory factor (Ser/Thr protein kinase) [Spinactinospora alkalitolerans]